MTTQPNYLRYLESAKQAEVAERLRREGWRVEEEKRLEDVIFDLAATRDGEAVAYEFKTMGNSRFSREQFNRLTQVAANAGYKLRWVVAVPPERTEVQVEHLADHLTQHLIEHFPSALDALSTHTQIDGITDLAVHSIHVGQGTIRVSGSASVEVTLQYGSASDDGTAGTDTFPLQFTVVLDSDGQLSSVENLDIDTSDFYE